MDFSGMEVMMGIAPVIGASLIGVGGSILGKLLNRGNEKAARNAQAKLNRVADSEARLNDLTLKELNKLFADIANAQGNPQKAFTFEQWGKDPQGFMDSVMNMTGMNMRKDLLGGRGVGGNATSALAGLTESTSQKGADSVGGFVQNMMQSYLFNNLIKNLNQNTPTLPTTSSGTGGGLPR